ncbi:hypothetical protein KAJ02_09455, partial [Candidatus Bipolaricaulota bacterium]|nr:hypothetical protein [Candidatus Bipolaricaulota bacterium]
FDIGDIAITTLTRLFGGLRASVPYYHDIHAVLCRKKRTPKRTQLLYPLGLINRFGCRRVLRIKCGLHGAVEFSSLGRSSPEGSHGS